jgi:hypothetical protein
MVSISTVNRGDVTEFGISSRIEESKNGEIKA